MARLTFHDIEDAEALAAWVVRRSGLDLSHEDRQDAEQTLLLELWKLSLDFDPSCGRRFDAFAVAVLRRRLTDWQRKAHDRTVWRSKDRVYTRELPKFTTLDDRPDLPDPSCSLDTGSGGLSEILGLDGSGDRGALPGERQVGEPPDHIAA
jgi:DNA-directed RNA polymerase specialized sigma24 family protein